MFNLRRYAICLEYDWGGRQLAVGGWQWAVGSWQLAVGPESFREQLAVGKVHSKGIVN